MAILHRATITPTKLELAAAWLDRQGLGGAGDVEMAATVEGDGPPGGEVRLCRLPGDLTGHPAARRCLMAAWQAGAGVVAVSA